MLKSRDVFSASQKGKCNDTLARHRERQRQRQHAYQRIGRDQNLPRAGSRFCSDKQEIKNKTAVSLGKTKLRREIRGVEK